eukprot:CAMPEP_0175351292 /NCGR_PEP_ID=MMETSP0095-20121207/11345_1 /TAXON_ID=311494 /ORGANISM="Alexandrium monilatum, Strain CCMP3105" /LENGTH=117 /DNA_ID=CAMNT_0016648861 /DNA_START=51 /DNA_END=404 /DNA_ORIENTATION=+
MAAALTDERRAELADQGAPSSSPSRRTLPPPSADPSGRLREVDEAYGVLASPGRRRLYELLERSRRRRRRRRRLPRRGRGQPWADSDEALERAVGGGWHVWGVERSLSNRETEGLAG